MFIPPVARLSPVSLRLVYLGLGLNLLIVDRVPCLPGIQDVYCILIPLNYV